MNSFPNTHTDNIHTHTYTFIFSSSSILFSPPAGDGFQVLSPPLYVVCMYVCVFIYFTSEYRKVFSSNVAFVAPWIIVTSVICWSPSLTLNCIWCVILVVLSIFYLSLTLNCIWCVILVVLSIFYLSLFLNCIWCVILFFLSIFYLSLFLNCIWCVILFFLFIFYYHSFSIVSDVLYCSIVASFSLPLYFSSFSLCVFVISFYFISLFISHLLIFFKYGPFPASFSCIVVPFPFKWKLQFQFDQ